MSASATHPVRTLGTVLAVASRELGGFYRLPSGWIVTALYLLLCGGVFAIDTLQPGEPATLRGFFGSAGFVLIIVAPAISMRLLSEEHRAGTMETLATAPVGDAALILGKYLGALACTACVLAGSLVYPVALTVLSSPAPDPGPILLGYLSLGLAAAVYLAFGLLASSLTTSQTLAYLASLLGLIVLQVLSDQAAAFAPAPLDSWLASLAVLNRIGDFAKGVLDTAHVVFLLGFAGWALSMAWLAHAARRWP